MNLLRYVWELGWIVLKAGWAQWAADPVDREIAVMNERLRVLAEELRRSRRGG